MENGSNHLCFMVPFPSFQNHKETSGSDRFRDYNERGGIEDHQKDLTRISLYY